ncbi:hypothetical protein Ccar_25040 [Clostridium carboxidivorans P7]|uniref:Filament cap protein n=1 Tax=Clostridium carboxidivorans P7 TaxID=536227 RepID=C6PPI9_9CLOT|nr:flagellar cap protein FliD N-terminal domain-containing protein [Clostridium carboxidivorans]AKN33917.1 hypothetical protein Ccar_25040 [Clostridium carboxidivorans P7]EET88883.1 flagellar hook-associated protein 2 domain protein [Clostridium carboxidivorans P7]
MSDVSTAYSGTTGAGGGSRLRITGMASGLDVDATVKKMLTPEQTAIDKANQTQQINQWRNDAYLDIIKDLKDLQNTYFSSTSADSLTRASNYSSFDISSSTPAVATATANSGAVEGTYIVKVNQLAKAASVRGQTLNSQVKINDIAGWGGGQVNP